MAKMATRKMSDNFLNTGVDRLLRRVLTFLIVGIVVMVAGIVLWGFFALMWHLFVPYEWSFLTQEKINTILVGIIGIFAGMFVGLFLSYFAKG